MKHSIYMDELEIVGRYLDKCEIVSSKYCFLLRLEREKIFLNIYNCTRIHVIVKLWHTEKPEDLGGKGYENRI